MKLTTHLHLVPRLRMIPALYNCTAHRNNFTFSFIHLLVHKFMTIRYTSVFITHHPFTFMYNIFVKLDFTFHKKISYIKVCKVAEYCDCHCALSQVH